MALSDQTIDVPFHGGLDEDSSQYSMPIGQFTELRNVQFNKDGEMTPRPTLADVPTYTDPVFERIVSHNRELFGLHAGFASSSLTSPRPGMYVLEDGATSNWSFVSELPEYINRRTPAYRDIANESNDADFAEGHTWDVFAFAHADGGIRIRCVHRDSGRVEESVVLVYTTGIPYKGVRVVSAGGDNTYVGVFYQRDELGGLGQTSLFAHYVNTQTATVSIQFELAEDMKLRTTGNTCYDVCTRGTVDAPGWYVVYRSSTQFEYLRLSSDLTVEYNNWFVPSVSMGSTYDALAISWFWDEAADAERLLVAYAENTSPANTAVWYETRNSSLTAVSSSIVAFTASYNTAPRGLSAVWADGAPAIAASFYRAWTSPLWLDPYGRTIYKHLDGKSDQISIDRATLTSKLWAEEPARATLSDGNMNASSTSAWTALNGATVTKVGSADKRLRVARNTTWGGARQKCLTYGKQYRLHGSASCGSGRAVIANSFANDVELWSTSGTGAWETFDVTFTALSPNLELIHSSTAGSSDFDNFTLEPLFSDWLSSDTKRVCGYTLDPETPVYHLVEFIGNDRDTQFGAHVRPITTTAYGEADASSKVMGGKLQSVSGDTASQRSLVLPVLTTVPVGANPAQPTEDILTGFDKVTAYWGHPDAWQTAVLDNVLYIGGGLLCEWDGFQVAENGFIMDPAVRWAETGTIAAPAAGTYGATMTWTYEDAMGRKHESQPAIPFILSANGTKKYGRYWRPLTLSMRNERYGTVFATHWQTPKNGSVYYKAFPFDETRAVVSSSYVTVASWPQRFANVRDFTSGTLFTEGYETSATYRATLYAPPDGSGELANFPVWGGCTHLTVHANRLWAASAESPNKLKFSKELTPRTPVSFYPPDFDVVLADDVTGMASLGDSLIVFTADKVYIVQGIGPDNRGQNGTFTTTLLPTDQGCVDWRSIVVNELGVFFQSARGMQLLTRGLSIEEVGLQVRETFTGEVDVLAAYNVPNDKQVRWVVDSGSLGATYVYDYRSAPQRWYVWDYAKPIVASTVHNGDTTMVTGDGALANETGTTVSDYDNSTYYRPASWKTGWLTLDKLGEYKRSRKVGFVVKQTVGASPTLPTVSYEIESSDCATQTGSFSASDIATASTRDTHGRDFTTLVVPVVNQLARAFKVGATLSAGSGARPLLTFIGLTFDVGLKPGIRRR